MPSGDNILIQIPLSATENAVLQSWFYVPLDFYKW